MHLVIYGPEGSGKGTQAKLLAEKFHLPIYTSGDLVREAAQKDKGRIGQAARKALSLGEYVSDEIMYFLWEKRLESSQAKKGFILDGFPRNINQAKFLWQKVKSCRYSLDKFIYLQIDEEEAKARLLKRSRSLYQGSKILHDTPSRIKKRLKIYRQYEKELLEFFRQKGLLLKVNGAQEREKVFQEILVGLKEKNSLCPK